MISLLAAQARFALAGCAALLSMGLLGGCATSSARDPLESYNRVMFTVNDAVDRNVLKPVAEGYRAVVPALLRSGVQNFFANLGDVWIGTNNMFQGKVGDALSDWMRVVLNTSFGIVGFYDMASDAGLPKHNEDFGQTLGWWGVPSGPYLVLPFFGPSTLRDAPALVVDVQGNLVPYIANGASNQYAGIISGGVWTLNIVNQRAGALDATNLIELAALDRYSFIRDAYLQRRQSLVYDGNPPRVRNHDKDSRRDLEGAGRASMLVGGAASSLPSAGAGASSARRLAQVEADGPAPARQ